MDQRLDKKLLHNFEETKAVTKAYNDFIPAAQSLPA